MGKVVNVSFHENKILFECEKCNEINVGLSELIKSVPNNNLLACVGIYVKRKVLLEIVEFTVQIKVQ